MRLIPSPPGKVVGGTALFEGQDLLAFEANGPEMRAIRGGKIAMIFQEPMTSLNPVFRVGDQMSEVIRMHQGLGRSAALEAAIGMLERVRIPDARKVAGQYPHQLSGGMRQRVMIAMELSCRPALLIADEPTTALDVTIQAQILRLLKEMRREMGTSILLITHDLGVVAQMCDRVAVMYAGSIVEQAGVADIFQSPRHPYTQGLWGAIPLIDDEKSSLAVIPGTVPDLSRLPEGCKFHPRCERRFEPCDRVRPEMTEVAPGHFAACHLFPGRAAT
jgi:oligopeptide/dipeptide ABC transporter ATP-binding protein